jgi:hypothetical protein
MSVRKIEIHQGLCAQLLKHVRCFVQEQHQVCIGIQREVPGFQDAEFRHWCVADDVVAAGMERWRRVLTLKTSYNPRTRKITAESCTPLHTDSKACDTLVAQMLRGNSLVGDSSRLFLERIYSLGIRALRIDCGYNADTDTAFLNEFATAPDASMWSHVHDQDLAYVIGKDMADDVWSTLTRKAQ